MAMQLAEQLPKAHELPVTSIAYDQARGVVYVGAEHPDIRAWSMRSPNAPLAVLRGHKGNVSSLAFCDGIHVLISGALDGLCIVWDERYKVVQVRCRCYDVQATAASFDSMSHSLMTCCIARHCVQLSLSTAVSHTAECFAGHDFVDTSALHCVECSAFSYSHWAEPPAVILCTGCPASACAQARPQSPSQHCWQTCSPRASVAARRLWQPFWHTKVGAAACPRGSQAPGRTHTAYGEPLLVDIVAHARSVNAACLKSYIISSIVRGPSHAGIMYSMLIKSLNPCFRSKAPSWLWLLEKYQLRVQPLRQGLLCRLRCSGLWHHHWKDQRAVTQMRSQAL